MQIQAVNNYSNYNNYRVMPKKSNPNFQAGLSDRQYEVVISRLKKVNSGVKDKFSPKLLDETINAMVSRYECLGVKSVALQIISTKDLPDFLGTEAAKYDLNNKIGLCIAVGNKYGPIEQMTNIYDAVTFLASEEDLARI